VSEQEREGREERVFSEAELEAAVERLSEGDRFAEAERVVSRAAPGLQRILASALGAGGWFGESHEAEILKAATTPDSDQRLTSVRTLLAEEARLGMMVGVAIGWALHEELLKSDE
jgi:hypothetical protein